MDFTSFAGMLMHRGLFFSLLNNLDDRFEGSIPRQWTEPELSEGLQAQGLPSDMVTSVREVIRKQRSWVMVNCWHMNEEESAAMWKLYARNDRAIAVQSTYQRLRDSLDESVQIGTVTYISYDKDSIPFGNLFWPFVHKRKSFEHERELRALTCDVAKVMAEGKPPDSGEWRSVDLDKLVEAIYIAPSAEPWFAELVKDISSKYAFRFHLNHSSLDLEPLY
jgi:hypothetical protein